MKTKPNVTNKGNVISVGSRGRITIPSYIRKSMGLSGGEVVSWIVMGDGIEMRVKRP